MNIYTVEKILLAYFYELIMPLSVFQENLPAGNSVKKN